MASKEPSHGNGNGNGNSNSNSNSKSNLFFLAVSKNKATVYEYDVSFSSCIVEDIEEQIKRSEADGGVPGESAKRECADVKESRSNGTLAATHAKKTGNKFNNDFVINRGIRIYKEFDDVELATCTNDYKKIILVRKGNLHVAEVIELQGETNGSSFQIRAKTPIKAICSSPKDSHLVLYCQYKPEVSAHNLFVYRVGGVAGKKKKKKKKGDAAGKGGQRDGSEQSDDECGEGGQNEQHDQHDQHNQHELPNQHNPLNAVAPPVRVDTLKSYSSKTWPFYKWSDSESVCALRMNSSIFVYKDNDFASYVSKAHFENLEFFDVSPEQSKKKGVLLATYERGSKGKPSVFKIFNSSNLQSHLYTKSFFNSDEMKLSWNKNATAVLLNVHTQVDKEKQYYYGLSNLFFIETEKYSEVNIMTDRGQIYDCIWSYNQNKFYVCKGDIPAEIVSYDRCANVAHSFGRHKFNTLKLNGSEKLLLTGGFGNLSGDITLWNTSTKKEVTKTKSSCAVVCEFFNDGKHFLTATTHPRLRVDNHLKIFTHNGFIVSRINFEELYNVIILPLNKIKFCETDASLGTYVENSNAQMYIHKQLGIDSKKTGVYRAPGTSAAASFTLNGFMNAKKTTQRLSKPKTPGANFVQEQKKKAPQKKKKKKKNQQTGEGDAEADTQENAEEDAQEDEP